MVKTGCDEYCINCSEWREYDENGCCKICGKRIKKNTLKRSYINVDDEYNKKAHYIIYDIKKEEKESYD